MKKADMQGPILLIGMPRSGTSTLAMALRQSGIKGYLEGHLMELLPRIEQTIAAHYENWRDARQPDTMIYAVSRDAMINNLRHFYCTLFNTHFGGPVWFDKTATPSLMPHLPILQTTFPNVRFIFSKRRPIEFLISGRKKFPHLTLAELTEAARFTLEQWLALRHTLEQTIEIDQWHLANAKSEVASQLATFIGLQPVRATELATALNMTIERSSSDYAEASLERAGFTHEEISYVSAALIPVMDKYNYGWTSYWKNGQAPAIALRLHGTIQRS